MSHFPLPHSNCHPEATASSSPKDPGAPREASRTLRGNKSRVRRVSKSEVSEQNQIGSVATYPIPLDLWYILPAPVTHPPPRTHLPVRTSQGTQIRTLLESLAFAVVNPPHPVIPTGAKRERAQWRDLAFGRPPHNSVTTITDASAPRRKTQSETQGPSTAPRFRQERNRFSARDDS